MVIAADGVRPSELRVPVGASVLFRNEDVERHRLRSDADGARFDTGDIAPGESASVTFSSAGTYDYADERSDDSRFSGRIIVGTSTPSSPAGETAVETASVSIGDGLFSPAETRVAQGASVRWTNTDDREHTATSASGAFDSGSLAPSGAFTHRFAVAGTFPYRCDFHPDMTGTVVVAPSDGSPPPPPVAVPAPAPASPRASSSSSTASLTIEDFRFNPSPLTVATGTAITVLNAGRAAHTATAPGTFDTGTLRTGQQATVVTARPGSFAYSCLIHPDMKGTLVVEGDPVASPPPRSADLADPTGDDEVAPHEAVTIKDFAFSPPTVEVAVGTRLTWTNDGVAPHTVTGGALDSGLLEPGDRYSHLFESPGTFSYRCEFHPQMTGVVRAVSGSPANTGGTDGEAATTSAAAIAARGTPRTGAALAGAGVILAGTGLLLIGTKRFMSAA